MLPIAACLCAATLAHAQSGDDDAARRHGIAHATTIPLPCAINTVPHFDSSDEDAIVATALTPYGNTRTYIVTLREVQNGIVSKLDDPSYHKPAIFQSVIPVKDNAGNSAPVIVAQSSDAAQRIAFLRANFDARTDKSEVIFVTANRIGADPGRPTDIMVYRLHEDPIIDGEIVYFAPAFSWQTSGAYATATEALEKAFGVKLAPDGGGACMQ